MSKIECLCSHSYFTHTHIYAMSMCMQSTLSSKFTSSLFLPDMSTLNHLLDLQQEQICYVQCSFCTTVLLVIYWRLCIFIHSTKVGLSNAFQFSFWYPTWLYVVFIFLSICRLVYHILTYLWWLQSNVATAQVSFQWIWWDPLFFLSISLLLLITKKMYGTLCLF